PDDGVRAISPTGRFRVPLTLVILVLDRFRVAGNFLLLGPPSCSTISYSPWSGLSETQSNVPKGTRKRNPLAAIAAEAIWSAIARDCERRQMRGGSPLPQLRLSRLATVPVRIKRFSSEPASPVTSPTACAPDSRPGRVVIRVVDRSAPR